jgi:single-stranded DNA-binding protein
VRVIGSLHTRSWEDRESGQKRFKTVVCAEDVVYQDARQDAHDEPEAVEETVEDLPF